MGYLQDSYNIYTIYEEIVTISDSKAVSTLHGDFHQDLYHLACQLTVVHGIGCTVVLAKLVLHLLILQSMSAL